MTKLQVLASSPLVLEHLEGCAGGMDGAAAARMARPGAPAPGVNGDARAQCSQQLQGTKDDQPQPHPGLPTTAASRLESWARALAAAGRAPLLTLLNAAAAPALAPTADDAAAAAAFAAQARLIRQLRACLRRLQPHAIDGKGLRGGRGGGWGPGAGAAVDPSGVRAALTPHVPAGDMEWGGEHDSSEALEVRRDPQDCPAFARCIPVPRDVDNAPTHQYAPTLQTLACPRPRLCAMRWSWSSTAGHGCMRRRRRHRPGSSPSQPWRALAQKMAAGQSSGPARRRQAQQSGQAEERAREQMGSQERGRLVAAAHSGSLGGGQPGCP
jgi:hypothetical protein